MQIINLKNKTVLICPLDWGLGHATRDTVIINNLLSNNCKTILGGDKAPLFFLRQEFPQLEYIKIPSVKISYHKKGSMFLKMLLAVPKLLIGIYKEHKLLNKVLSKNKIDVVISDNRFGLWNKKVTSIFITHQIRILMPKGLEFLEKPVYLLNKIFINKYNYCLIPDFENEGNLSGKLSHDVELPKNTKYIGILSRFDINKQINQINTQQYDILAIISGPEPQRTIFENILISQLKITKYKCLIIRGKPLSQKKKNINNITFKNHLKTNDLQYFILKTPIIITRSGYSTIMDLVTLKKTAAAKPSQKIILVPTPGQTEQEYLANYLKNKKMFYTIPQKKFNLENAIKY